MELNVGYYVRTKSYGIKKINNFSSTLEEDFIDCDYDKNTRVLINKKDIVKSSPNIIDLIEVGDYVNGWRVNRVEKEEDGTFLTIGKITSFVSKNEKEPYLTQDYDDENKLCKIGTIVTKQQFEAMQYAIKED